MANGLFLSNSQYTSPPIISILKLGWSPSTEPDIPQCLHPTSEGAGRRRQPCQLVCGESHLPEMSFCRFIPRRPRLEQEDTRDKYLYTPHVLFVSGRPVMKPRAEL